LSVSAANQKIREFIVTKALVSAQPPSLLPAAQAPCPECEAEKKGLQSSQKSRNAPVDAELEKEIEKLLAEIEKSGPDKDPLGVAVPWEEKYGNKGGKGKRKKEAAGLSRTADAEKKA
jgi:hypothetical protein